MPDPTTATLSNGAVVKVGDVVCFHSCTKRPFVIEEITPDGMIRISGHGGYFAASLFVAALAQSAPTVPAERLRALAKRLLEDGIAGRKRMAHDQVERARLDGYEAAMRECAAALEALADGGK